ncbi:lipocalin family protein [Hymenobacter sp. BT730]|uniref:lipocalin family protein n=1 Tax=Hymenobacter sp. BT730 TaxID=3063332 RepID=UPI0026DEC052|nr:lipocalin family protein [Hymenobacter sp. BT730]
MKTRRPILFAAAATVVGAAAMLYSRARQTSLPVVPHVDLKRYVGLWYEIARLPTRFEKDCVAVTAEYNLQPDGTLSVRNSCHRNKLHSPAETATGTARVADRRTNAKLKVSFFWPFAGDYWILDLEGDYQYALVGEPKRENLWILSRHSHLERSIRDKLVAKARRLGFPVEKLIFTPQPDSEKS